MDTSYATKSPRGNGTKQCVPVLRLNAKACAAEGRGHDWQDAILKAKVSQMATWYASITDEQADLIRKASLFFVATADPKLARGPDGAGPVNVSPKGGVPLHILDANRVAFLDYTGSGNETARHASAGGPITLMVCSFESEQAGIVRLYGKAYITPLADSPVAGLLLGSPAEEINLPMRQVIEIDIEKTMTSCGYGVPVMSFVRERTKSDRGRRYKEGGSSGRSRRATSQ